MVRAIEVRRRYMMSGIPIGILQACIISVVFDHLLLIDAVAISISKLTVGEFDQSVYILASEGSFSVMRGHRWTHLLEYHGVVFRHDSCFLLDETT